MFRFLVEFTREPDALLGDLGLGLTMGQWLSIPIIAIAAALFASAGRSLKRDASDRPAKTAGGI